MTKNWNDIKPMVGRAAFPLLLLIAYFMGETTVLTVVIWFTAGAVFLVTGIYVLMILASHIWWEALGSQILRDPRQSGIESVMELISTIVMVGVMIASGWNLAALWVVICVVMINTLGQSIRYRREIDEAH